jgi:hypothetical protein
MSRKRPLRLGADAPIHLPRFAGEERAAAPPRAGELSTQRTEGAFGA